SADPATGCSAGEALRIPRRFSVSFADDRDFALAAWLAVSGLPGWATSLKHVKHESLAQTWARV
ncbi:MAG TPA: hypothetical protein DCK93_19945, partial [Blastocatellia bacterium]|nr:hypothetical protein [Blastocatellia bacterium]